MDSERQLHEEYKTALEILIKETEAMYKLLSAIKRYPASDEERIAIMRQRLKENTAQRVYYSARQALIHHACTRWP